jgi:hypothetical protein
MYSISCYKEPLNFENTLYIHLLLWKKRNWSSLRVGLNRVRWLGVQF